MTKNASAPIVIWFRRDLRRADHPALHAATQTGRPVVPVYIETDTPGDAPGAASRWWLHHALSALAESLAKAGAPLIIRRASAEEALRALAEEVSAGAVYWNRCHEPSAMARDRRVKKTLEKAGVEVKEFVGENLFDPEAIRTQSGDPYKVFTPFWKSCLKDGEPSAPLPAPGKLQGWSGNADGEALESLKLLPAIDWAGGMRETWTPGEAGALEQLHRFLEEGLLDYPDGRDRPDRIGTSRLSPYLHHGDISPRTVWQAVRETAESESGKGWMRAADVYLREVGWREFALHLLLHFPHTLTEPLRDDFKHFPWKRSKRLLNAWQQGRTGYPMVDAGMRELWHTGWMHNRVRMIAASFLVKDLLQPWQDGEAWFRDTLVDADLASNVLGWQWTAGCGADAAPYFRVFNPVLQGKKFDPDGIYVRQWVPELAKLDGAAVHEPWKNRASCPAYPEPIVDHFEARDAALEAYDVIK